MQLYLFSFALLFAAAPPLGRPSGWVSTWLDGAPTETIGEGSLMPPSEAVPPDLVRLHLTGTGRRAEELVLQRRSSEFIGAGSGVVVSGQSWVNVCSTPCGRTIDAQGAYSVNAMNQAPMLGSKQFNLSSYAGQDATVDVRPGRPGLMLGGFFVLAAGTATSAAGGVFLIDEDRRALGGVLAAVGVSALVGGVFMVLRAKARARLRPGLPSTEWQKGRRE